jgi:DNA invertase Pin-like site-specific DNA recombinase
MRHGYIRLIPSGETAAAVTKSLRAAGCEKITREHDPDQTEALEKLLDSLKQGDVVVVTELEQLAPSVATLVRVVESISASSATVVSLADPWMAALEPAAVVAAIRSLSKMRNAALRAGRKRARSAGVAFGRPKTMTPAQVKEARRRHKDGEGVRALARSMNVPVSVMSRALRSKD